jgi:hypothetical protein
MCLCRGSSIIGGRLGLVPSGSTGCCSDCCTVAAAISFTQQFRTRNVVNGLLDGSGWLPEPLRLVDIASEPAEPEGKRDRCLNSSPMIARHRCAIEPSQSRWMSNARIGCIDAVHQSPANAHTQVVFIDFLDLERRHEDYDRPRQRG